MHHSCYNAWCLSLIRWGLDKFPKETPLVFYRGGKPIEPPLGIYDGLKVVLKSMASYIEREVPSKTLKLWRSQSPRHFYGGEWDHNGSCVSDRLLQEHEVTLWVQTVFASEMHFKVLNHDAAVTKSCAARLVVRSQVWRSEQRSKASEFGDSGGPDWHRHPAAQPDLHERVPCRCASGNLARKEGRGGCMGAGLHALVPSWRAGHLGRHLGCTDLASLQAGKWLMTCWSLDHCGNCTVNVVWEQTRWMACCI